MKLPRGSVVTVNLDPSVGHEQGLVRPCVVVTREDVSDQQRFRDVVVIVPVTSKLGLGPLYPVLQPYARGLSKPSTVLVDMIRGVDKQRVVGRLAPLPEPDLKRVDDALRRLLAL